MDYAEAKRKDRERKRSEGYVLKQIWCYPDDWEEIKKAIDAKNKNWERGKK